MIISHDILNEIYQALNSLCSDYNKLSKLQKDFGYKNPKTSLVSDYFIEKGLPVGY